MINASSHEVFSHLLRVLKGGEEAYLITVISTWGSSPRPPGALMFWSEESGVLGSVSGGCVEEDLIQRLRDGEFAQEKTSRIYYGGDVAGIPQEEHKASITLPCGGTLQLVIERLDQSELVQYQEILTQLQSRQGVLREVDLTSGEWTWKNATFQPTQCRDGNASIFLGPSRKLLIVGANQVGWYLAAFANSLDFAVSVCDPNPDLAAHWFTGEFTMIPTYPDDEVMQNFGDANCAIVAVSHDPRLDDMALLDALPSEAFYVGAMGSMATSKARRERLTQFDISPAQLEKLHAPIGIDIGSKTPAEIAISIASQLVKEYKYQNMTGTSRATDQAAIEHETESRAGCRIA